MLQAHGGSIRVESEPGAGATFTVELPCARHASAGAKELPAITGDDESGFGRSVGP